MLLERTVMDYEESSVCEILMLAPANSRDSPKDILARYDITA